MIAPMRLFWMLEVPVDATVMPPMKPPDVVEVTEIAPVPVVAPMVFGDVVPTFTAPARTLMPSKMPGAVLAALVVVREIAVIVFPWMLDTGEVAAVNSIAKKRMAAAVLV